MIKLKVKLCAIWAIAFGHFSVLSSQAYSNNVIEGENNDTMISIVFGGDLMGHGAMIKAAWNESDSEYHYQSWFQFITPYLNAGDFVVANLEVTLAGKPYTGYPQFSSPDAYAKDLQSIGIDYLVTANNHSLDRGSLGLERTIQVLDEIEMGHTGTFVDSESRSLKYPSSIEVNGFTLALLNYTYGTNGLVVSNSNVVNYIDINQIEKDFQSPVVQMADIVIPVMHWGSEYQLVQNAEQKKLARSLSEFGSSAIIGMHPHVVQPIENFQQLSAENDDTATVPVVYSLGNFISNQRQPNTDGGILVKLNFIKSQGRAQFVDMAYLPFWVWRLTSFNKEFNLQPGYYLMTKNELGMLKGDDLAAAKKFFENTCNRLRNTSEWAIEN